ncbi:hypothetical protein FISHEDRAFT_75581 [Fistulina hepatica ATCC 64428]|uniref:Uncharacterized protein n=1 Tax=Fistulina hepatica ATCC 64428 TaxID=1128425 RepID=A0A0D7A982_9AGAR|nr:hypothetical protein FISHEDRAFT_75581 [Fistulina hepatica ATCC 64428]
MNTRWGRKKVISAPYVDEEMDADELAEWHAWDDHDKENAHDADEPSMNVGQSVEQGTPGSEDQSADTEEYEGKEQLYADEASEEDEDPETMVHNALMDTEVSEASGDSEEDENDVDMMQALLRAVEDGGGVGLSIGDPPFYLQEEPPDVLTWFFLMKSDGRDIHS